MVIFSEVLMENFLKSQLYSIIGRANGMAMVESVSCNGKYSAGIRLRFAMMKPRK